MLDDLESYCLTTSESVNEKIEEIGKKLGELDGEL